MTAGPACPPLAVARWDGADAARAAAACAEFGAALQPFLVALDRGAPLVGLGGKALPAANAQDIRARALRAISETAGLRERLLAEDASAYGRPMGAAPLGPPPLPAPPAGSMAILAADMVPFQPQPRPDLRSKPVLAEPRFAVDSLLPGLLPDTVEVGALLEQLDAVNGTIRELDEMMAAAGVDFGSMPPDSAAGMADYRGPAPLPPPPGATPATMPGQPLPGTGLPEHWLGPSAGRLGDAEDTAHIASLLCSPEQAREADSPRAAAGQRSGGARGPLPAASCAAALAMADAAAAPGRAVTAAATMAGVGATGSTKAGSARACSGTSGGAPSAAPGRLPVPPRVAGQAGQAAAGPAQAVTPESRGLSRAKSSPALAALPDAASSEKLSVPAAMAAPAGAGGCQGAEGRGVRRTASAACLAPPPRGQFKRPRTVGPAAEADTTKACPRPLARPAEADAIETFTELEPIAVDSTNGDAGTAAAPDVAFDAVRADYALVPSSPPRREDDGPAGVVVPFEDASAAGRPMGAAALGPPPLPAPPAGSGGQADRAAAAEVKTPPPLAPLPASAGMQVIFTGFARGDLHRLRRCVSRLGGAAVRELPPENGALAAAVRVVVRCSTDPLAQADGSPAPQARLAASRTIKYFDAILAGAWVLSPEWVLSSYTAGRWLPEAGFELAGDPSGTGGPAAGRERGPQLFAGLRLHFPPASATSAGGKKDPSKLQQALEEAEGGPKPEDLERLARRGGAEVLSSISELPEAKADPPHLGPGARAATSAVSAGASAGGRQRSSAAKDTSAAEPRPWWRRPIAVITSGGRTSCSAATRAGWAVLPASWMLDCISLGEISAPAADWLAVPTVPAPATAGTSSRRTSGARRRPSVAEVGAPSAPGPGGIAAPAEEAAGDAAPAARPRGGRRRAEASAAAGAAAAALSAWTGPILDVPASSG
uniref:BRCT domain-containing protein n=1 Tax=Alexandrium monilatum TaxID=311494 RepID=A0A7S4VS18_9DINO